MESASNTNIHGFEDMPDVLPVPHILDYDWRFSRQGLEYMANSIRRNIKKENAGFGNTFKNGNFGCMCMS